MTSNARLLAFWTLAIYNAFACYSSVPSGGLLKRRERSRPVVGVKLYYVVRCVRSFSSTVIGNKGYRPVALNLLRMFDNRNACSLAQIYIDVYSLHAMQLGSSRETALVSAASVCFSSENTLTSSGCSTWCCELASHMLAVAYTGLLRPVYNRNKGLYTGLCKGGLCIHCYLYMTNSPYLDRKTSKWRLTSIVSCSNLTIHGTYAAEV